MASLTFSLCLPQPERSSHYARDCHWAPLAVHLLCDLYHRWHVPLRLLQRGKIHCLENQSAQPKIRWKDLGSSELIVTGFVRRCEKVAKKT